MKHSFVTCEYSRRAFRIAAMLCAALFATQTANAQTQKSAAPSAMRAPSAQDKGERKLDLFSVRAQIPTAPFRWFASTDAKHRNADYLLLKPGETRRIPLAAGNLLRLWSTSLFPDQTTLVLQNKTRVPLLQNGVARVANCTKKRSLFIRAARKKISRMRVPPRMQTMCEYSQTMRRSLSPTMRSKKASFFIRSRLRRKACRKSLRSKFCERGQQENRVASARREGVLEREYSRRD